MTDIGVTTPALDQDVAFTTDPKDAAGLPAIGTFQWTLSDPAGGTLEVAADGYSAKLITAAGEFTAVVTVTDIVTQVSDTATVSRQAGALAAIGLKAALVAKS